MRKQSRILIGLAVAALAALAWLATRSQPQPEAALAVADAGEVLPVEADPQALVGLEPGPSAIETTAPDSERRPAETRTIRSAAATIQVQPAKVPSENPGMIIVWCYLELSHAPVDPEEIVVRNADGAELRASGPGDRGTFRGLAPGLYSVIVRDSRFQEARVDGVAPGSHVLVDLLGTVRVRPHAFDAETGAAIPSSELRLVRMGREKQFSADEAGWFCGLSGGAEVLEFTAPGFEPATVEIEDLRPGEAREIEVRFTRAGEVRCLVVDDATGAPLEGAFVSLQRQGGEAALDSIRIAAGNLDPSSLQRSLRSDAHGRVDFHEVSLGSYAVTCTRGPLLGSATQEVALAAGSRLQEIVLRMPAVCSLHGTLTNRGGAGADELQATLVIEVESVKVPALPNDWRARAAVQSDGSFEFDRNLCVGRVRVMLSAIPREDIGVLAAASTQVLGELDLHAGRNECRFDISALRPGTCSVEVVRPGVSCSGAMLMVAADAGGAVALPFPVTDGAALVGPLLAGDYRALALGPGGAWMSATPARLHIESGATTTARIELQLVPGRVVLQDEQGEPLDRGTRVTLSRLVPDWPEGGVQMAAELGQGGVLDSALEPGSYRLTLARGEPAVSISTLTLTWTESGPAQAIVRLGHRR